MNEAKEKLTYIILQEEISSIQLMSRRLGIDEDEVRESLDELIGDGILIGYISKDGQRFFRHDLKQPDITSKAMDDYVPEYGGFDIRLSIIIIVLGVILMAIGTLFYNPLSSVLFSLITLIGLIMCIAGTYCISFRRSPV